MNEVVAQGAICPGQKTLLTEGEKNYLRVVLTVYWMDACPSTEVFYLTGYKLRLNLAGIAALEKDVVGLIASNDATQRATAAIYIGFSGVEMSEDEATALGWRIMSDPTTTT